MPCKSYHSINFTRMFLSSMFAQYSVITTCRYYSIKVLKDLISVPHGLVSLHSSQAYLENSDLKLKKFKRRTYIVSNMKIIQHI